MMLFFRSLISTASRGRSQFSESHSENVGNDSFALGWFQTRPMRHAVHDVWPIFNSVMPENRQRVTFDAAVNKKRATFAQHHKISMLPLSRDRHLRSDGWNVVHQFATG